MPVRAPGMCFDGLAILGPAGKGALGERPVG